MSRGTMTHRAELRRSNTGTDVWNRPIEEGFSSMRSLGVISLRVSSSTSRLELRDEGKAAAIEELIGFFSLDLDIRPQDRLGDITDRQGKVLFSGPLAIKQPITLRQRSGGHQQAELERHSSG